MGACFTHHLDPRELRGRGEAAGSVRCGCDHLLPCQQIVGFADLPFADQLHDLVGHRRHHIRSQYNARAGALGVESNDPMHSPGSLESFGHAVGASLLDGKPQSQHGGRV
jgi:hypothetical protein